LDRLAKTRPGKRLFRWAGPLRREGPTLQGEEMVRVLKGSRVQKGESFHGGKDLLYLTLKGWFKGLKGAGDDGGRRITGALAGGSRDDFP